MTELLTSAQMRAIEAAAIASGEVTGLELMERAGRGVVEAIFDEWPDLRATSHRAVVLCGPGNNGGDGFVVARLLKEWGWEVEVFLYGEPEKMPPDARVNYERWRGMGEVRQLSSADFDRADVVVDALFGTGLSRGFDVPAALNQEFHHFMSDGLWWTGQVQKPYIVAVDVISELDADSGRVLQSSHEWGGEMGAHLTVTFHAAKVGHYLAEGPAVCGKLLVKDIGLARLYAFRDDARAEPAPGAFAPAAGGRVGRQKALEPRDEIAHLTDANSARLAAAKANAHKYSHGHALILSGPSGRGGAARLSARGALRIGAGVVTVGCPGEALAEHAARLDAIMLREVGEGADLAAALEDRRVNALCLGPGLGTDARAEGLVAAALGVPGGPPPPSPPHGGEGRLSPPGAAGGPPSPSLPHEGGGRHPEPDAASEDTADQPAPPLPRVGRGWGWGASGERWAVVLDADALTILSRRPDLFTALHDGCILTPHAGEFARLFPDIAEKLSKPATTGPAYSKVDATREAAARAGCVVLYKGPDTVIADPSGRCSINSAAYERAAPWLATAGSGDVLAGFIAGLLARGFAPMQAAETAAWLHVECARSFGPGLIAEDLPEELPKVFRALGL